MRQATNPRQKSQRDANSVTSVPRLVAIDLHAGPAFVDAVQSAWKNDEVVLPVDQRLPIAAKGQLYKRLGVDAVVSHSPTGQVLRNDLNSSNPDDLVPLREGDALIIATSGSTGEPKGVVHTHHSLAASARMVGERLDLGSDDHWWLCIPAAHIGGFGVITRSIHFGSRLSFASTVDQATIDHARENGADRTSVVPTLIARHRFNGWKSVLVGGASSPGLPTNALSTYGMTETAGGVVYDGLALSGVTVKIEDGEIFVQTPSLARTFRRAPLPLVDGWLATGDLGRMVDGRLVVDGRKDDLIITGGIKIWPRVVEARLREHALINDVVVMGVPDDEWGAVVVAYIVCSSAHIPTLRELREYVKETLSAPHAPHRLVVLDHIPRTNLGKVLRSELPGA